MLDDILNELQNDTRTQGCKFFTGEQKGKDTQFFFIKQNSEVVIDQSGRKRRFYELYSYGTEKANLDSVIAVLEDMPGLNITEYFSQQADESEGKVFLTEFNK